MGTTEETGETEEGASEGVWADITASDGDAMAHARVRDKHDLEIDEVEWTEIGEDEAPVPGDYLLVGVAGCQVKMLQECFEKARIDEYEIDLHVERERDFSGETSDPYPDYTAMRYTAIDMDLTVETTEEYEGRVRRCLDVCEDACVMSRSVEAGIEVTVDKDLRVR